MKRALVLVALVAVVLAAKSDAGFFMLPRFDVVGQAFVLENETSEGEAPMGSSALVVASTDAEIWYWDLDCKNGKLPIRTANTHQAAFLILEACVFDRPGEYCPVITARNEKGEHLGSKIMDCVTVLEPAVDVAVVGLSATNALEPHDPLLTAQATGPDFPVLWELSCDGDDDDYEVESADTDKMLSSQECDVVDAPSAASVVTTICVRATIDGEESEKACVDAITQAQVITPGTLVANPPNGPEPLDDVSLAGTWSTNAGAVDLIFKADDSATCPSFPDDDADCFQVQAWPGSSYNTLTDGGFTFDYASDGSYQPELTVEDTDDFAASITIPGAVTVTPVADPDPVFGIRFLPSESSCQRDVGTGACAVEMDPFCAGDAVGDITAGTLACGSGGTAHQGTVLPNGSVGANLDSWSAHATGMIWCDRMKTATYDGGTGGWGARLGATGVTHNSDKYPTAWTDGDGGGDANVGVFINRELDVLNVPAGLDPNPAGNIGHYPPGTYTLTCTGNAVLDLEGDASGPNCTCPNTCLYTVATPTEGGILVVAKTPFTSGTPDIDIRGPDACVGEVRSSWLEQVENLTSLRNIGGRRINESPPTTLATRTLPSRYSYSNSTDTTVATVPIEVEVAMANAARTDLYLNFPDAAANDLVQFELDYVANNLDPSLKVRVADGNEIWNGLGLFANAKNRHDAAGVGLCTAPCDEWFYYQMKRSMELWAFCEAEMGDARCINVLELQNADPTRSGATFMAYDPPTGLSGSIGSQVEEINVAPYINVNKCLGTPELYASTGAGGVANIPIFESWTPAQWHDAMRCDIPHVLALTAQHRANAALYAPGAQVGTYEWGSHWSTIGGPEHDVEVVRSAKNAHGDPGMRPLMVEFGQRTFEAMGGGHLHPLTLVTRPTHFNAWGFGWYDTDRSATGDDSFRTHPRWLALQDLAASQCAADPLDPPTCSWSTSGTKTTSDSGFSREGVADSDASTATVTVTSPPAQPDLAASCSALQFFAQNTVADDPAPPCQNCSVQNIGQGTLTSTNTLDAQATGWGATRSPASQTTGAETDTVTVCAPDPDGLQVGDRFGSLTIANSANAADAQTFAISYSITNPAQGGDPAWFAGRDGSNRPLVPRGLGRGNLTMHNHEKRATPNMTNLLGASMKQYDGGFSDSTSENALIYHSTFDRKNGQPPGVDCLTDNPAIAGFQDLNPSAPLRDECGTLPNGSGAGQSNEDTIHFPWGTYRSATTLFVANTVKNAIHRSLTCTGGSCPHTDNDQGLMDGNCPIGTNGTFGIIASVFGRSDSGQQGHMTTWRCPGNVLTFLFHGNEILPNDATWVAECQARGQATTTGQDSVENRDCGKLHFNVPNDGGNQGNLHRLWCIHNTIPIKGGSTGSNAVTAATRVVKVGQCTTTFQGAPTIVTYPTVEDAIAGELAHDRDPGTPGLQPEIIPDGIEISCKGWATPPANCIATAGDPD